MTTNITPREALEKIAKYKNKSCQGCGADEYSMLRARIGVLTETIKALKGIATQALAQQECELDNGLYIPQETAQNEFFQAECTGGQTDTPQECDVAKCPAYEEHGGEYWQGCWEFNDICQEDGYHCSDKPNCNFKTKQLHSQQKNFTWDKAKEIIALVLRTYTTIQDSKIQNDIADWAIEQFEKEVK